MRCGRRLPVGNYMTADFACTVHTAVSTILTMAGLRTGVDVGSSLGLLSVRYIASPWSAAVKLMLPAIARAGPMRN